ncbi:hypothetical protein RFI_04489 [Reticulomyxa filosa]|uniref:Uncharacterized protein n=1 Tax=Reticulomyxa filosa TaxID=46433 RepID=X6P3G5_RETFI|nr:hypothetical protein RFI_04489 [Reticulomyxa filosa]|eukprot:ETO32629.1 hypothetical protein RFI_04489 [Reticulomyxa filosa]
MNNGKPDASTLTIPKTGLENKDGNPTQAMKNSKQLSTDDIPSIGPLTELTSMQSMSLGRELSPAPTYPPSPNSAMHSSVQKKLEIIDHLFQEAKLEEVPTPRQESSRRVHFGGILPWGHDNVENPKDNKQEKNDNKENEPEENFSSNLGRVGIFFFQKKNKKN